MRHQLFMRPRPITLASCLAAILLLGTPGGPAMAQHAGSDTVVFRSLEEALREPDKVRSLDLSDRKLGAFPAEVLRFTHLQELRLRNDGITALPSGIKDLKELRLLDLSGNPISTLPQEFGELESLEVLYLNEDEALDLEADIEIFARLPRLRELHLEHDGLKGLPGSIVSLRSLEALYLNENKLDRFPAPLMQMPGLKLIDLRQNPIAPLMPLDLQQRGVLVRF